REWRRPPAALPVFAFAYFLLVLPITVSQLRLRNSILAAARVQTDKLIDSFFVTHAQIGLGAEEFFHQKMRDKLQVQTDISKPGVHVAGEWNGRLLKQSRRIGAQASRNFSIAVKEVLMTELDDVDVHQPPVVQILRDDAADGPPQLLQRLGIGGLHQGKNLALPERFHFLLHVLDQADEDVFLVGVVKVELAHGDAGTLSDFADGSAVKPLPGKKLERGAFDLEPVPGDGVVQKLGHSCMRSLVTRRALALVGEL